MKIIAAWSFVLVSLASGLAPTYAAEMSGMDMSNSAKAQETQAIGVVEEINQAKGVVTISHEAIASLDWPPMTMKFIVQDKNLLSKLAQGKTIHFGFISQHGKYLITQVK